MIWFLHNDAFWCHALLVLGSILLIEDVPKIIISFYHIPWKLRQLFCERFASKVLIGTAKWLSIWIFKEVWNTVKTVVHFYIKSFNTEHAELLEVIRFVWTCSVSKSDFKSYRGWNENLSSQQDWMVFLKQYNNFYCISYFFEDSNG